MVTKFKNHLARTNLARNTINSYVWTIEYFLNHYGEVNKRNLLAYKGYLGHSCISPWQYNHVIQRS